MQPNKKIILAQNKFILIRVMLHLLDFSVRLFQHFVVHSVCFCHRDREQGLGPRTPSLM